MRKTEKRILVVDDDAAIRTLLLTVLRRRGLAVDTAKNGAEAMEKLQRCSYAVMLLDLMMPVASGWQVLDYLRQMDAFARPAVILLTAGSEPRGASPDLVMGTIRKPFDVELLYDTVIGCLSSTAPREQTPTCPPPESDKDQPIKPN
jgi:CheY-like chemotaxis protein